MWSLKGLVNVKFNDNPFIQLDEAGKWTLLGQSTAQHIHLQTRPEAATRRSASA